MEELYKKYGGIRGKKVNKVLDTHLTFSFNRYPIRARIIAFPILILAYSLLTKNCQFLWVEIFFMILLLINKSFTYHVLFDNEKMIIKNFYKSEKIYYKNGIRIFLQKKKDKASNPTDRIFFKEGTYRYNLIVEYNTFHIILTSVFTESSSFACNWKEEIEKFFMNFTNE